MMAWARYSTSLPTRTSRGPLFHRSVVLTTVKQANNLSELSTNIGVNIPCPKDRMCLTCRGRTVDQGCPPKTCRLSARDVAESIDTVAPSPDEVKARHSTL